MSDHRFHAMGSEIVVGGGSTIEHMAIERLFRGRDRLFSRFIAESELNRVNRSAGRFVLVSQVFAETLQVALWAAAETDGLVDPTLGQAIGEAGYSCDFSLLAPDPMPPGPAKVGVWPSVHLIGRSVGFPCDVQLDLNGVVKSLAVDDALALLGGNGFVSAGGDVSARGELTVALPDGRPVSLREGALATSGSTKRRWLRAGDFQHHLIDPRSGVPARSPWAQVTACGANCLAADIAAKAGFLLGEDGPAWLDERGIPALFLTELGETSPNAAWARSVDEALACT